MVSAKSKEDGDMELLGEATNNFHMFRCKISTWPSGLPQNNQSIVKSIEISQ